MATYKQFKQWSDLEWIRQQVGGEPQYTLVELARRFEVPIWRMSAWIDRYRMERIKKERIHGH
jgi:hypothetical protein